MFCFIANLLLYSNDIALWQIPNREAEACILAGHARFFAALDRRP